MDGRVMRSTGSWYEVLGEDGKRYQCRLQGKLRLEGIKETNPIAIGDVVDVLMENDDASITAIRPRQNHMLRQSVKRTGHSHVLAANVDQVMVIATLKLPRTSLGFIDRFFVSAESFRIPQILVFNKMDLLDEEEKAAVQVAMALYSSIGATPLSVSSLPGGDLTGVEKVLQGKTTLVAGHSGVGKSTMLNRLSPEISQTVKEISEVTNKGFHTTTFAEMFMLNDSTFVIDTPGVKEWGLVEMNQQEISDYFPEMRDVRLSCKFGSRCLHLEEPGCAVLKAVGEGQIAVSRYQSYFNMVTGQDNRK